MDGSSFDALVKGLGATSRRRSLVGTAGAAVLAALFGLDGADEALAKRKKKGKGKKKACKGQRCGDKCISPRACCTDSKSGRWIAEGGESGQCGICIGGNLIKDPVACLLIDETGCTDCDGNSFQCVPAPDDTPCGECGSCDGGLCEDPDPVRACGSVCCSGATPVCVDESAEQCCARNRACGTECCQADSGFGLEDGEICTRDGCCLEVKAANNCRAEDTSGNCAEKICCAHVWTQEGRGEACSAVDAGSRDYCCGPGKSCCFSGCCPSGYRCCGDEGGRLCCPTGQGCGGEGCTAPVPDHV
jgi:hypothetical protein